MSIIALANLQQYTMCYSVFIRCDKNETNSTPEYRGVSCLGLNSLGRPNVKNGVLGVADRRREDNKTVMTGASHRLTKGWNTQQLMEHTVPHRTRQSWTPEYQDR